MFKYSCSVLKTTALRLTTWSSDEEPFNTSGRLLETDGTGWLTKLVLLLDVLAGNDFATVSSLILMSPVKQIMAAACVNIQRALSNIATHSFYGLSLSHQPQLQSRHHDGGVHRSFRLFLDTTLKDMHKGRDKQRKIAAITNRQLYNQIL